MFYNSTENQVKSKGALSIELGVQTLTDSQLNNLGWYEIVNCFDQERVYESEYLKPNGFILNGNKYYEQCTLSSDGLQTHTFVRSLALVARQLLPAWSNSTSYLVGDIVVSGLEIWRASQDNLNSEPTDGSTDWTSLRIS